MTFTAGNRGDAVRSDCWVEINQTHQQGISIEVKSKVKALYGNAIASLATSILEYYKIENASVYIEDKGALDFVIAARIEAVVKQSISDIRPYITSKHFNSVPVTSRKINRFSRLYIPGNSPKLMLNAGIYGSGGVILDLEDSVANEKKDEARILVRNALNTLNFKESERMVRINQLPLGIKDLNEVIPEKPNLILIPKCESSDQVIEVDKVITDILGDDEHPVYLMPIIETALGVINAYEIAKASKRNVALALGLEDYTADIGAQRTNSAKESFYARSAVVNAARAAGIQPIDSVFSDVSDMETLVNTVKESKALGFVGMGCIHPRQVAVINEHYAPSVEEIKKAQKIVIAFEEAKAKGQGVVSLGSKMIDPPVVDRALNTIDIALKTGKLKKEWRTSHV
jgi:citrate lyase subunit beta/citryl-CoA lyase